MKIGILTLNWAVNYGAVLQMYALYKYLIDKNNEVVIINYSPKELEDTYSLRNINNPLKLKKILIKLININFKYIQYKNLIII